MCGRGAPASVFCVYGGGGAKAITDRRVCVLVCAWSGVMGRGYAYMIWAGLGLRNGVETLCEPQHHGAEDARASGIRPGVRPSNK